MAWLVLLLFLRKFLVSCSIFSTNHLMPRKKHLKLQLFAFADGGNWTWAAWVASKRAIHYTIASRHHSILELAPQLDRTLLRKRPLVVCTSAIQNSTLECLLLQPFCNTGLPLTSTKWDQSALHCPFSKQWGVDKSRQHWIWKKSGMPRIKPWAIGREARLLSTVLCSPPFVATSQHQHFQLIFSGKLLRKRTKL